MNSKKCEQRKKKAIPRRFTKINVVRKQCSLEALNKSILYKLFGPFGITLLKRKDLKLSRQCKHIYSHLILQV